ncbi:MAG: hypothetical protein LBE13_14675, partial [Bacteroidales bacterium]|nr:hypothetical protein [Bacteroidales bacterium]
MEILRTERYKDSYKPQPWHAKLDEVKTYFENRYHQDITTESGFNAVMATEGLKDMYNDMVASLVTDNEHVNKLIKNVSSHTMADVRNPLTISTEATDSLANNANYSALAKLNSWVIVGYTARSKCLELYYPYNTDQPTISFKYNISYLKEGNKPEEYIRPNADRDGDLGPLYDLPVIAPSAESIPNIKHLENKGISYNGVNNIWIKIAGGVKGNIFDDNGGQFDPNKYTLEKNPMIVGVFYNLSDFDEDADTATGSIRTYAER